MQIRHLDIVHLADILTSFRSAISACKHRRYDAAAQIEDQDFWSPLCPALLSGNNTSNQPLTSRISVKRQWQTTTIQLGTPTTTGRRITPSTAATPNQHANSPPLHATHGSPGSAIPLQLVVSDYPGSYPGLVVRDIVPAAYAKNGVVRSGEGSVLTYLLQYVDIADRLRVCRGASSGTVVDDPWWMRCILVRRRLSPTRIEITPNTCCHSSSAHSVSSPGCSLGSK